MEEWLTGTVSGGIAQCLPPETGRKMTWLPLPHWITALPPLATSAAHIRTLCFYAPAGESQYVAPPGLPVGEGSLCSC